MANGSFILANLIFHCYRVVNKLHVIKHSLELLTPPQNTVILIGLSSTAKVRSAFIRCLYHYVQTRFHSTFVLVNEMIVFRLDLDILRGERQKVLTEGHSRFFVGSFSFYAILISANPFLLLTKAPVSRKLTV